MQPSNDALTGMVEGLLYGYKAGLNLNDVIAAVLLPLFSKFLTVLRDLFQVSSGAAGSWSISNYGPRILKGDLVRPSTPYGAASFTYHVY